MHTRNILFLSLILMFVYTAGYAHNETGSSNNHNTDTTGFAAGGDQSAKQ